MRMSVFFALVAMARPLAAQEKPTIWIAPNAAWRVHANSGDQAEGEVENRSVEVSANFAKSCKDVAVNADRLKADYVIEISRRIERAYPTKITIDRTDVAVYRPLGNLVGGASKGSLGAAVKSACEIVKKDWPTATHESPKSDSPESPQNKTPGGNPVARPTSLQQ